jgi:signal transduction histidine kinase/CheY-like chemotaxis protein
VQISPVPERLKALCDLDLVDTPPDPALEDIVRLARIGTCAPIALVSLVDRDRRWLKACVGLDAAETSRDVAFWAQAVLQADEPFVVEDASLDPRFADNPLVVGPPHLRAYAAVPILGCESALALGMLCVLDRVPRRWSTEHEETLRALARMVEQRSSALVQIAELSSALLLLRQNQGQLDRTRSQMYDAIESLDAGIVLHDADGELVLWNRNYQALTPEIDALRGSESVTLAGGHGSEPILVPGEHKLFDRWVRVSSRRTEVGGLVTLVTDISSLKKSQEELLLARQIAEEAVRAKARFLATMSHEIRTPMNGVIGMAELLFETILTDEQREYAGTIRSCGDSLMALINDILDFSKIEAGKLHMEAVACEPRSLLEDSVALLAPTATAKGLRLVTRLVGLRHSFMGDPTRLRQVLLNLIGNALKFTERGEVLVAATTRATVAGRVILDVEVRDTGIGIPPEALPRLFEAFSQADPSTTRKFGGTGLGLAICRSLVTLMGGRISLESELGKGSSFRVSVELPAADIAVQVARRFAGYRALCAEPHEEERRALSAELFDLGFEVEEACTADEALNRLSEGGKRPLDLCVLADGLLGSDDEVSTYFAARSRNGLKIVTSGGAARPSRSTWVDGRIALPLRRRQLMDVLSATLVGSHARIPATESADAASPGRFALAPAQVPEPIQRALIVDDNPINARIARAMLQKLGWTVENASDGVEALDRLEKGRFDIVWMDCEMPRMDGFTATRAVRAREPAQGRTYIVALTAGALAGDREACLGIGMDDYITKPMRQADLEHAIARWRVHTGSLRVAKP